ncbi:hypothetical protein [Salmonella enterica]
MSAFAEGRSDSQHAAGRAEGWGKCLLVEMVVVCTHGLASPFSHQS